MGKRQVKKIRKWQKWVLELAIDMLMYFVGILLLTACVMGEGMSLDCVNALLPIWAGVTVACGSLITCGGKNKEASVMRWLLAAVFLVLLVMVSYLFWEGPVWDRRMLWFVVAVLAGSGLSALLAGKGKSKNRRGW